MVNINREENIYTIKGINMGQAFTLEDTRDIYVKLKSIPNNPEMFQCLSIDHRNGKVKDVVIVSHHNVITEVFDVESVEYNLKKVR